MPDEKMSKHAEILAKVVSELENNTWNVFDQDRYYSILCKNESIGIVVYGSDYEIDTIIISLVIYKDNNTQYDIYTGKYTIEASFMAIPVLILHFGLIETPSEVVSWLKKRASSYIVGRKDN